MQGSMCFDCTYRQSGLQIETSKFYQDSKIAVEDSAVADHSRRTVYEGPDLSMWIIQSQWIISKLLC